MAYGLRNKVLVLEGGVRMSRSIQSVLTITLLLTLFASGQETRRRRVYVPDEKTAEGIAKLVLIAQFGEERVTAQLPLRAESKGTDLWLVQGTTREPHWPGGNMAVWVNRHSGCIKVTEQMK
jgi:hypothetical protein